MIAWLTIQKYACRSFSSSGTDPAPAPSASGVSYRAATSNSSWGGTDPGSVGACETCRYVGFTLVMMPRSPTWPHGIESVHSPELLDGDPYDIGPVDGQGVERVRPPADVDTPGHRPSGLGQRCLVCQKLPRTVVVVVARH